MRHRSNIAFVLLAAALFAAPQVSHDLSTLKGEVAACIRGGIFQAFLGLHASESAGAPAAAPARRTDATLASCTAPKPEGTEAKGAPAKAAPRAATQRRSESSPRAELAMLGNPDDKNNAGLPPGGDFAELASLPSAEALKGLRLAMLTQPGNGVEPPPSVARYNAYQGRAGADAARAKFEEIERHAAFVKVSFERGAGAEWVSRVAADAAHVAEDEAKVKTRVVKMKRQVRSCADADEPLCGPRPAPAARPAAPAPVSVGE
jgi:hypothetical protein